MHPMQCRVIVTRCEHLLILRKLCSVFGTRDIFRVTDVSPELFTTDLQGKTYLMTFPGTFPDGRRLFLWSSARLRAYLLTSTRHSTSVVIQIYRDLSMPRALRATTSFLPLPQSAHARTKLRSQPKNGTFERLETQFLSRSTARNIYSYYWQISVQVLKMLVLISIASLIGIVLFFRFFPKQIFAVWWSRACRTVSDLVKDEKVILFKELNEAAEKAGGGNLKVILLSICFKLFSIFIFHKSQIRCMACRNVRGEIETLHFQSNSHSDARFFSRQYDDMIQEPNHQNVAGIAIAEQLSSEVACDLSWARFSFHPQVDLSSIIIAIPSPFSSPTHCLILALYISFRSLRSEAEAGPTLSSLFTPSSGRWRSPTSPSRHTTTKMWPPRRGRTRSTISSR